VFRPHPFGGPDALRAGRGGLLSRRGLLDGKRVYLETMGCQMNVLDSELVLGMLRSLGYEPVDDHAQADLVLLNTCSVRRHAEDKVYSRLGEIARDGSARPGRIIGVIGCMAERDHAGLLARAPFIDLLCGPGRLDEIPALIAEAQAARRPAVALEQGRGRRIPRARRMHEPDGIEALDMSRRPAADRPAVQAYVRVQRGCDKFCSFCVVPYTRGPERSRPPAHIVEEVRRLVDGGVREITLLGQTVNSYHFDEAGRTVRFADLLERVHAVPGLDRLRFVTSYPGDFDDDIFHAMRCLPRVCGYLHIPAQSGSDAVLRRMRRQYTAGQYLELLARARELVPGISLAGDFIVGFCGETEEDHAATLALVERAAYKSLFMFMYSPRPDTAADRRLVDDVPAEVKRRRHAELAALQRRMSLRHHRAFIGREVEILVEGYSKAARRARAGARPGARASWPRPDQLTGRTPGDEIVVFSGPASLIGRTVRIRITGATALTLHGEPVEPPVT